MESNTEQPALSVVEPQQNVEQILQPKSRAKHKCPFPDCSSEVVHLPRHMRAVHNWSKKRTMGVLNVFNLRKSRSSVPPKRKFKRMMCPMKMCNVKRLHNHLTGFHKLKRGSKIYKEASRLGRVHDVEDVMPCDTEESVDDSESTDEGSMDLEKELRCATKKSHTKHPSIFKNAYQDSDEDVEDDGINWANVSLAEDKKVDDPDFMV